MSENSLFTRISTVGVGCINVLIFSFNDFLTLSCFRILIWKFVC